jgi:hypothetical protein
MSARQKTSQVFGYLALASLCCAMTLGVPAWLMGLDGGWSWLLSAGFVAGVWFAATAIGSPLRAGIALMVMTVTGGVVMDSVLTTIHHKEVYQALWLGDSVEGWHAALPASPFALGAFALAILLLLANFSPPRELKRLSLAFIACAIGVMLIDAIAYLFGQPRFVDPLQVLLRTSLLPLAASSIVVLASLFIIKPWQASSVNG